MMVNCQLMRSRGFAIALTILSGHSVVVHAQPYLLANFSSPAFAGRLEPRWLNTSTSAPSVSSTQSPVFVDSQDVSATHSSASLSVDSNLAETFPSPSVSVDTSLSIQETLSIATTSPYLQQSSGSTEDNTRSADAASIHDEDSASSFQLALTTEAESAVPSGFSPQPAVTTEAESALPFAPSEESTSILSELIVITSVHDESSASFAQPAVTTEVESAKTYDSSQELTSILSVLTTTTSVHDEKSAFSPSPTVTIEEESALPSASSLETTSIASSLPTDRVYTSAWAPSVSFSSVLPAMTAVTAVTAPASITDMPSTRTRYSQGSAIAMTSQSLAVSDYNVDNSESQDDARGTTTTIDGYEIVILPSGTPAPLMQDDLLRISSGFVSTASSALSAPSSKSSGMSKKMLIGIIAGLTVPYDIAGGKLTYKIGKQTWETLNEIEKANPQYTRVQSIKQLMKESMARAKEQLPKWERPTKEESEQLAEVESVLLDQESLRPGSIYPGLTPWQLLFGKPFPETIAPFPKGYDPQKPPKVPETPKLPPNEGPNPPKVDDPPPKPDPGPGDMPGPSVPKVPKPPTIPVDVPQVDIPKIDLPKPGIGLPGLPHIPIPKIPKDDPPKPKGKDDGDRKKGKDPVGPDGYDSDTEPDPPNRSKWYSKTFDPDRTTFSTRRGLLKPTAVNNGNQNEPTKPKKTVRFTNVPDLTSYLPWPQFTPYGPGAWPPSPPQGPAPDPAAPAGADPANPPSAAEPTNAPLAPPDAPIPGEPVGGDGPSQPSLAPPDAGAPGNSAGGNATSESSVLPPEAPISGLPLEGASQTLPPEQSATVGLLPADTTALAPSSTELTQDKSLEGSPQPLPSALSWIGNLFPPAATPLAPSAAPTQDSPLEGLPGPLRSVISDVEHLMPTAFPGPTSPLPSPPLLPEPTSIVTVYLPTKFVTEMVMSTATALTIVTEPTPTVTVYQTSGLPRNDVMMNGKVLPSHVVDIVQGGFPWCGEKNMSPSRASDVALLGHCHG